MLRVGLTGGIGAGKSTVARRLVEHGAVVVDADRLARDVVEPDSEGLAAVVGTFGPGVLTPDGALDRPALGALVFGDEDARLLLNGILHPRIAALTAERVAAAPVDAVVVHDVPLLVENRMGANYHLVVVVHAPVEDRVRRLVVDRGMAEADARARIASQADDAARRAAGDVWLENTGRVEDVAAAVDELWVGRIVPFEENLQARRAVDGSPDPGRVADPDGTARVVARVARAVRADAADVRSVGVSGGLELELVVGPDMDVDGLAAAGFFAFGEPGCYGSADPGRPVTLRVRRDVPDVPDVPVPGAG